MTDTTPTALSPEELAAKLRIANRDGITLCGVESGALWDAAASLISLQAARIADLEGACDRMKANHKAELIEIGDAAGSDLRHHGNSLLRYSAVACVKRLRDERNDLLNVIDDAWEAFGTAGNRSVLTLAEQIGSIGRELDEALARATAAEAALAASLERVRVMREALETVLIAADEVSHAKGRSASVRGASDQKRRNMEEWVLRTTVALENALMFARAALQPQEATGER